MIYMSISQLWRIPGFGVQWKICRRKHVWTGIVRSYGTNERIKEINDRIQAIFEQCSLSKEPVELPQWISPPSVRSHEFDCAREQMEPSESNHSFTFIAWPIKCQWWFRSGFVSLQPCAAWSMTRIFISSYHSLLTRRNFGTELVENMFYEINNVSAPMPSFASPTFLSHWTSSEPSWRMRYASHISAISSKGESHQQQWTDERIQRQQHGLCCNANEEQWDREMLECKIAY